MPGSPFQKRKYREIAAGIGSHIHVEVVTEEIGLPVGVPSPVTVRLGKMAFAAAGRTAFFLAITDPFFPLLRGSADRSAVTGKSQMLRIDQALTDGTVQELLFIEPEDQIKWILRFHLPAFQQGKKLRSSTGRVAGCLFPFLVSRSIRHQTVMEVTFSFRASR